MLYSTPGSNSANWKNPWFYSEFKARPKDLFLPWNKICRVSHRRTTFSGEFFILLSAVILLILERYPLVDIRQTYRQPSTMETKKTSCISFYASIYGTSVRIIPAIFSRYRFLSQQQIGATFLMLPKKVLRAQVWIV